LNQDYDIGFRVDMGDKIGSGHFFRCLALANEFIKRKRKVVFITNTRIIKNHINKKIGLFILKGKKESEQIEECKKLSKKVKFWIFDLPKENGKYSFHLRKYNSAIIDDLGGFSVYSTFLFNGGIVKKFQKYNNKNKTKIFLGPEYIILRESFHKNKNSTKISKNPIRKILLTFGGNDDNDLTSEILTSINTKKYHMTVLLGPTYKFMKKIQKISKLNKNIKIISNIENTSILFQKFDLVITTPGITIYELACLGIPTLSISINKNQNLVAKSFQKRKFGMNNGFWKKDISKLEKMINSLNEHKVRKNMKYSGQKIVDGKGVRRVSKIINEFFLQN